MRTTIINPTTKPPVDLIIIGSAAVDIMAQSNVDSDSNLSKYSTVPGKVSLSLGGVARNVAEASHRILAAREHVASSLLVAPVGEDVLGKLLLDETQKLGMRTDGFLKSDQRTAVCNMVLDNDGNLVRGVADMDITQSITDEQVCLSEF
jgi:pseudouridine-5'-phosphate glycosidase/pseudouridine kinase